MSNQDKNVVMDHIIYPYNEITKKIFFLEKKSNEKDIFLYNKLVVTQQVSNTLAKYLTVKGFIIKPTTQKIQLSARNKVCGVPVSISKIYDGKQIKELIVTIGANDHEELIKKRKTLTTEIKSVVGIDCKYSTSDKFVRC